MEVKLFSALKIINGSYFRGTQKLWIMQHLLIPKIQWPLLMSLATSLVQKVSTFICKWLHLHHSMSNLCFYSAHSPCLLLIKSLILINNTKASKINGLLLLKNSHGALFSSCPRKLQTGTFAKGCKGCESCEWDRTWH